MFRSFLVFSIFTLSCYTTTVSAASSRIETGSASGKPGSSVMVPVQLVIEGAGSVAAVGLDIDYDASKLEHPVVVAGAAASAAHKTLITSTPKPGHLRIGIFGFDTKTIGSGELAKVTFSISPAAKPVAAVLSVTPSASTLSGTPYPLTGNNGVVTILP